MGVFDFLKGSTDKRLDEILERLKLTYSNNYKDDSLRIYKEFNDAFDIMKRNGKLNDKQIAHYTEVQADYEKKLAHFQNSNKAPSMY